MDGPVTRALLERRSVRAFLPTPVERHVLEAILAAAARAPSGTNMQPWRVHVLTGAAKARLSGAVLNMRDREPQRERPPEPFGEYPYNPEPLPEPYLGRRRKVGWDLYSTLGIAKGDRAASWLAAGRNFEFYGAPVGLIFTMDRALTAGSYLDYGIFLQSVMLAARDHGLDTCAQAAWRHYHDVIREKLALPADQLVVCGMSLGRADIAAPAHALATEREPVACFARFLDGLEEHHDAAS
jgi:nitroreductase